MMSKHFDTTNPKPAAHTAQRRGPKVYLGGLDYSWREQDIHRFMVKFGTILDITIARHGSGEPKGYGFVTFSTTEEAEKAQGFVTYQNKTVVVKPSIKHPKMTSSSLASKGTARSLQLIENLTPSKETAATRATHPKQDLPKSTALSKHSKNFTSTVPVKTWQDDESEKVTVKVFNLSSTSSSGFSSLLPAAENSLSGGPDQRALKASEKSCQISKHSKEFHPRIANQPSDFFTVGGHPAVFHAPGPVMISQYGNFKPTNEGPLQEISIGQTRAAEEKRHYQTDVSAITIKFFTFPGRE